MHLKRGGGVGGGWDPSAFLPLIQPEGCIEKTQYLSVNYKVIGSMCGISLQSFPHILKKPLKLF